MSESAYHGFSWQVVEYASVVNLSIPTRERVLEGPAIDDKTNWKSATAVKFIVC